MSPWLGTAEFPPLCPPRICCTPARCWYAHTVSRQTQSYPRSASTPIMCCQSDLQSMGGQMWFIRHSGLINTPSQFPVHALMAMNDDCNDIRRCCCQVPTSSYTAVNLYLQSSNRSRGGTVLPLPTFCRTVNMQSHTSNMTFQQLSHSYSVVHAMPDQASCALLTWQKPVVGCA